MRLRLFVFLICSLAGMTVLSLRAHAQRYPFYNLNIEQGLIQSQATSLAQDAAGHLWIGTLGGLSRFDGRSFTSYSVRDGLPSNSINVLRHDRNGLLWIGTDKGLASYDGRSFRQFSFQSPENPQGNNVTAIAATDAQGVTYCIAGRKLFMVRDGKVQSVPHPLPDKFVTAIHSGATGVYLALARTDTCYHKVRSGAWEPVILPPAAKPYSGTRFFEDRQQQLWLTSAEGLIALREKAEWHRPEGQDAQLLKGITSITQSRDGSYWLGTRSGLLRIIDTTIRRYQKRNGLTDNTIFDLLTDAEGNVWIATDGQGLFRFSGAPFTALDESMNLPSAQIMGLADDGEQGLYLGTYDAGLFRYAGEKITPIPFPEKYVPNIVTLARDANGALWIGTRGEGLWRYAQGRFRQFTQKDDGLPSGSVTALRNDPATRKLWIGFADGAAIYEADSFRLLPIRSTVLDFLPLGDGSAVLATAAGLKLFKDNLVAPYLVGSAAESGTPQCLARQGKYLWIGTSDNGVIAYDTETQRGLIINKKNGLRSDFVYNIFAAADGHVWVGTGYGIYSIRLEQRRPVIAFYGRGQGVTGIESNHNAVLGLADGSIWFGTTNGAMHYRPGILKTSAQPASIVLQSVKLFGEAITDSAYFTGTSPNYGVPQQLELPYRKNNLTFTFQAISLSDESAILYRYRMTGLDPKWSEWGATNTITYSALPPGRYVLEVQCSNRGQPATVQTLKYAFHIITPFHKTGLFRLLIFGGCILLGVSLQYMANRRRSARQRMIEALRREEQSKVRERTAEDFHDEVGNKLTRINVLTNVLKSKLGDLPPDAARIIQQIQENTGQLYSGTRDILWSLKPSNDSLYEIVHRIRDFGQDLFGDTDITFTFSGSDEQLQHYRLPLDMSRNLIMIFKEAMNNGLKYSGATEVRLTAHLDAYQFLHLELHDNGKGFDPDTVKRGNGLANMSTRAGRLNAVLQITSANGAGTTLSLAFKIPPNRG